MIGRFGDRVTHLPSARQGKIVMHPAGSIGVFSTAVEFDPGRIEEFPDSELRLADESGQMVVSGMRFASNRPIPDRMLVQLHNNGDGTVTVTGQVPGGPTITLYNLPIQNGEVVLPDEKFFPVRF